MPVVPATWEAKEKGSPEPREVEASVNHDGATVLQPGKHSETMEDLVRKKERDQTKEYDGKK